MPGGAAVALRGGFRLGRIGGVPVEVHPGFFVTAGVLASVYWRSFRLFDVTLAAALVAVLLVSVLAHECGHALAARRFKVGTRLIEINVSGGLAHLDGPAWTTNENCLILLAGPLANLALAAVAYLVFLALWSDPEAFETASDWGELIPGLDLSVVPELFGLQVLRLFVLINAGLCTVNLLPGFPLDGGRIAFLLLSRRWGTRTATRAVGVVGVGLSVFSVLLLIGTTLSGFAVLIPPRFRPNWHAVRHPAKTHPWG